MRQMTWTADAGPGPIERGYQFVRWVAYTLALAWFAPFGLLALFAAVGALFGVNADDVRENVVGFATLDASAWSSAGPVWHGFALACGLAMAGWRVFTARPVQALIGAAMDRAEAWWAKALAPLAARLAPAMAWLDRLPRAARAALVVGAALAVAGLVFLGSGKTGPTHRVGPPPPLPKPAPSAALTLADGAIRSGAAIVEQRDADSFVVVFKKEAAK